MVSETALSRFVLCVYVSGVLGAGSREIKVSGNSENLEIVYILQPRFNSLCKNKPTHPSD